jgi:hypothetical protein
LTSLEYCFKKLYLQPARLFFGVFNCVSYVSPCPTLSERFTLFTPPQGFIGNLALMYSVRYTVHASYPPFSIMTPHNAPTFTDTSFHAANVIVKHTESDRAGMKRWLRERPPGQVPYISGLHLRSIDNASQHCNHQRCVRSPNRCVVDMRSLSCTRCQRDSEVCTFRDDYIASVLSKCFQWSTDTAREWLSANRTSPSDKPSTWRPEDVVEGISFPLISKFFSKYVPEFEDLLGCRDRMECNIEEQTSALAEFDDAAGGFRSMLNVQSNCECFTPSIVRP